MGRPKGAKNRRTLLREAEAKAGKLRDPSEIFDTLYMIEVAASYFFRRALEPREGRKAEQIDQDYRDAAHLAVLAAPFRHSKLTATKILGDPNNPVRFNDNATADELRAEIMKRLEILTSAGLIDLQALPAPKGGIANQPIPGVNQPGINGEWLLHDPYCELCLSVPARCLCQTVPGNS